MNLGIINAFLHASFIGQIIWVALFAALILVTAIFFHKRRHLQTAQQSDRAILSLATEKNFILQSNFANADDYELSTILPLLMDWQEACTENLPKENIKQILENSVEKSLHALEKNLNWLASASSNAPYVGLLGTVAGIIKAFEVIGVTGSASLQSLGPAIAEALYATGLGLFVAILATLAYNRLAEKVETIEIQLNDITSKLLARAAQEESA